MSRDRRLLFFQSVALVLLVYLAISHRIIDAKTLTERDTEDAGNSRSDEGEQIVEKTVEPVQLRGANLPTVKKDLEEASRSDVKAEAEAEAGLEAELEGADSSKKVVLEGKSRTSDPDMPSYDPFHTTTNKPNGKNYLTKLVRLEDQEDSSDEKSEPEKGSRADSSLEETSEGSRSEVETAQSDKEEQAKSRSDELEVSDGSSRADSETSNTNAEDGSRSASEDSAGDSRSSDEASETPANADGSRAEKFEPDLHYENSESNIDGKSEEGKPRAAIKDEKIVNLLPKDGKPRRKRPKPNVRPWYDPEKPTTTSPPPMTTDLPMTTRIPTTTQPPTTTKLPTTTKPPTTAKPTTTTKVPATTKLPTTPMVTPKPTTKKPAMTTTATPKTTQHPIPTTKPPCGYGDVKDSDKLLAVVKTARGGFKGRRINAKAIEKIMNGKLDAGQIELIKQDKAITVSSNSSYVFPAGTYYFPYPIRFAGFISP